eukprot:9895298-Alexandrium_andersonii.AAC.1
MYDRRWLTLQGGQGVNTPASSTPRSRRAPRLTAGLTISSREVSPLFPRTTPVDRRFTTEHLAPPGSGPSAAVDVPSDAMALDDARGVVRKSEEALSEHPEVAQSKRTCSPSPA